MRYIESRLQRPAAQKPDLTVTLFASSDVGAAIPGGDAGAARALAQAAAERLATVDVLRARLARGLDLTVSPHPA